MLLYGGTHREFQECNRSYIAHRTAVGSGACRLFGAIGADASCQGHFANTAVGNGATINGSITGRLRFSALSLGGERLRIAQPAPGLIVTVVGTSMTAPVNPNGTFVLTNVPPGDIQLRFTGPGTDALAHSDRSDRR